MKLKFFCPHLINFGVRDEKSSAIVRRTLNYAIYRTLISTIYNLDDGTHQIEYAPASRSSDRALLNWDSCFRAITTLEAGLARNSLPPSLACPERRYSIFEPVSHCRMFGMLSSNAL